MPIKRKLAKEFDTWDRIISMALESIRLIRRPLTDHGWQSMISKELEIDLPTAIRVFEELVTRNNLIFTRIRGKRSIYISDRTPEHRRYS